MHLLIAYGYPFMNLTEPVIYVPHAPVVPTSFLYCILFPTSPETISESVHLCILLHHYKLFTIQRMHSATIIPRRPLLHPMFHSAWAYRTQVK